MRRRWRQQCENVAMATLLRAPINTPAKTDTWTNEIEKKKQQSSMKIDATQYSLCEVRIARNGIIACFGLAQATRTVSVKQRRQAVGARGGQHGRHFVVDAMARFVVVFH